MLVQGDRWRSCIKEIFFIIKIIQTEIVSVISTNKLSKEIVNSLIWLVNRIKKLPVSPRYWFKVTGIVDKVKTKSLFDKKY